MADPMADQTPELIQPGQSHENTSPEAFKQFQNTLNSGEDTSGRRLPNDEHTIWFGATGEQENVLILENYGRVPAVLAESISDRCRYRHPSLVSFIADQGEGKSRLIELLLDQVKIDMQREVRLEPRHRHYHVPVVSSSGETASTYADVRVYSDPSTYLTENPILYANCKSLDIDDQLRSTVQHNPYTSSPEGQTKSEQPLHRLMYASSDSIVFVVKTLKYVDSVITNLLLPWASSLDRFRIRPLLPHAIIAITAVDPGSESMRWDSETATERLINDTVHVFHQSPMIRQLRTKWAGRGKRIDTMKELLACYYSTVTVIQIPLAGRNRPRLTERLRRLYIAIRERCSETWISNRQPRRLLPNSDEMNQYVQSVLDRLSPSSSTVVSMKTGSEPHALSADFGAKILKLAVVMMAQCKNPRTLFANLGLMVASCIVLDCARQDLKEATEVVFEDRYLSHCDFVLDEFCSTVRPCTFVNKSGDRCANVKIRHAKEHQDGSGKIIGPGGFEATFTFDSFAKDWFDYLRQSIARVEVQVHEEMRLSPSKLLATIKAHRNNLLEFYHSAGGARMFKSHSACLGCVIGVAEHPLPCQHLFCTDCVKSYGIPDDESPNDYIMQSCPIHDDSSSSFLNYQAIRFKPPLAGVRILALDGGGIRSLASLEILRQVQLELGGDVPIQDFFDLIVGSSTGGIVALGLGLKGWSVDQCRTNFLDIMNKAFPAANIHSGTTQRTNLLEESLKHHFMNHRMFGSMGYSGSSNLAGECKVAVTSTTNLARQTVIFANYNRPEQQNVNYRLVRIDDPAKNVRVWEAARATTAMPVFFNSFTHPRTMETYLDGALNHNNPVMVAAQESKLLWPDLANHPPDIFLSLGNGQNDEETDLFPDPTKANSDAPHTNREHDSSIRHDKHTGFNTENFVIAPRELRAWKRAFDSSKSESVWKEFVKDVGNTSMSERFIRINPRIEHELPRIDDMAQLDAMQKEIEESLCTSQLKNQIKMIAQRLVASSFYFEQLGPLEPHEGHFIPEGKIQCRFAAGTENLRNLGRYLQRFQKYPFSPYFLWIDTLISRPSRKMHLTRKIIEQMINLGKFDLGPFPWPYSAVNISLVYSELAWQHERTAFPISGAPRALSGKDFVKGLHKPTDEQLGTIIEVSSEVAAPPEPWEQSSIMSTQSETLVGEISDIDGGTIHLIRDISDNESLESNSVRSHLTTPRELDAKSYVAQFLAAELCSGELENIDKAEFGTAGRRLLKIFYLSLVNNARTELERQSVRLLKSRQGRRRISYEIADMISAGLKVSGETKGVSEQIRMRKERLERWARGYNHVPYGPEPSHHSMADDDEHTTAKITHDGFDTELLSRVEIPLEPENETDARSVLDKSEKGGSSRIDGANESQSSDDDKENLPYLKDMETFFRRSESFPTLLNGLRLNLLPQSLRTIVLSTSLDNIWLSDQQEITLCNRLKGFVEDYTRLDWNWWPLEARMRMLKDDESRLLWRCSCGVRLWKEISRNEAKVLHLLLQRQDPALPLPSRCRTSQTLASNLSRCISALISQCALSSAGQKYTPPNQPGCSNNASQGPQAPRHSQSPLPSVQGQQSGTSVASQPTTTIPRPSIPPQTSWVIFGVKGSRPVLEIQHIPINESTNDSRFYRELRDHYRRSRGRFKLWFSFWRLGYCEVMKFKRLAPEWIIGHCKELPKTSEYKYSPRPPAPEALNPPISRHEFSMHLHACDYPCRWNLFHCCMPQLTTSSAVDCIPKKISPFDTASKNPTDIYAWGLEARYEISAAYVAFYHIVILAVPFAFWGWWQATHPGDVQNASIPVTVVIAMLSLFWGSNGILTQGRHFGEVVT